MGLARSWPYFLCMHVVFQLCLTQGFPHVAGSGHGGNETDRLVLLEFKARITSDPFRALDSWNESVHFCQWVGVTCGRQHQRVTVLNLNDQKLSGAISPHIGNLSFLKELRLDNNSLSHEIPLALGRLLRLQQLSLVNNSLTGEIPANISACSNLNLLDLYGNKLTGKIPAELGYLSLISFFDFGKNNLTGEIPPSFGNLSSLTVLAAAFNSIGGHIPDALGRLKKLETFVLVLNKFVGIIPPSMFNLSSITTFDVVMNQLQGTLPPKLGMALPNLKQFSISWNLFSGYIPISISNASKLEELELGTNKFIGTVPSLDKMHQLWSLSFYGNHLGTGEANDLSFLSSLTNATYLSYLGLSHNNFAGILPESVSNLSTNLEVLLCAGNKIFGGIPTGMRNLVNLQLIDLENNRISGSIPTNLWNLQMLQALNLPGNRLSGNIPSSFQNLTLLNYLSFEENNFHGSIPPSLGRCQFLLQLSFGGNNLTGAIPQELGSLSTLLYLNLSHNKLTGSLPVQLGNLGNLEALDVSGNMLSSEIPNTLGSCVQLSSLDMGGNMFSGILPSSLGDLRGLEELDLSHNNFSGKIPDYLESFVFLKEVDISFNDFEGAVPKGGIFKNATAIFVKGNKQLCGGIPELQLPNCHSIGLRRKRFSHINKIIIISSFGLVGLVLMFYFLYICQLRKTTKLPDSPSFGNSLSYRSLQKATNGFSSANIIGFGSFGTVYKGILHFDQNEKVVAVKVLKLHYHGASKSFIAECKALRSIKHRNLVKVFTACSSVDYQGNDFKALVYEFMVNGSLEEWLHPNENEDEAPEESRSLSLLQRLSIAIDVAHALDYLHHDCLELIVHCDLKPSNILLDDEMIGHVGDFGLARFLLEHSNNPSANQSSSVGIRGSVGYTAPEYGMGNEISTSGDVFSYGILLLEMFTGKRPTDSMFTGSLTLHNFAKAALHEQAVNTVDPTLFQQREIGEASSSIRNPQNQSSPSGCKFQECLISLLKVGIACSQELPTNRLDMKDAVTQLHAIRNTLLEAGKEEQELQHAY